MPGPERRDPGDLSPSAKLTSQQLAERLMHSGVLSKAVIQETWKSLPPDQRCTQGFANTLLQQGKVTRYQLEAVVEGETPVLKLGAYLIQEKLGEGGMGQVFRAFHQKMKRDVAVKIISPRVLSDIHAVQRFNREVEAAARLSHPNIVTAFDAGEVNDVHYLVMEYVEGRDLLEVVRRSGPLSPKQAVGCTLQAARGLGYAHKQGIIHRDIKPANLFLDDSHTVKILDMGLARLEQGLEAGMNEGLTGTGIVMGTIDYMAPEQAFDSKSATAQSDIYSLGCTLFFLMTGRSMYEGDTAVKRILAHREQPIPNLIQFAPAATGELQSVFERMVAKSLADRFSTMDEVVDALQPLLDSLPDLPRSGGRHSSPSVPRGSLDATLEAHQAEIDTRPPAAASSDAGIVAAMQATGPSNVRASTIDPGPTIGLSPSTGTAADADRVDETMQLPLQSGPASATAVTNDPATMPVIASVVSIQTSAPQRRRAKKRQPVRSIAVVTVVVALIAAAASWMLFAGSSKQPSVGPAAEPAAPVVAATILPMKPEPSADIVEPTGLEGVALDFEQRVADAGSLNDVAMDGVTEDAPSQDPPPAASDADPLLASNDPVVRLGKGETSVRLPTTLVVGVEEGNLPSLQEAFQQARPGDTILIRHRGPLEIDSTDLSDKTPLTIVGDQKDDTDFWPIVRQSDHLSGESLWFGDHVELTIRKVHLSVGGLGRSPLREVIRCESGELKMQDCTLTFSADGGVNSDVGTPAPLIRIVGQEPSEMKVTLQRCFVRGGRVAGLVHADAPVDLSVQADHLLWAGAAHDWITMANRIHRFHLRCDHSTLYNVGSLLNSELDLQALPAAEQKPIQLELNRSVVVGHEAGRSPLLFFADPSVPTELASCLQWSGQDVAFHRISAFFDSGKRDTGNLRDLVRLFDLNANQVIDADPMFRVYPSGAELEESEPRDFDVRFLRATRRPSRTFDLGAGVPSATLPACLTCVANRVPAEAVSAGIPRGEPAVLQVSVKNGPYRTLEDAFKALREDGIIEIVDDSTYTPVRNFDIDSAKGVLQVDHLQHVTLRAADGAKPTILLSDGMQQGTFPKFHPDEVPHNHCLFALAMDCQSLRIDGIEFRTEMIRPTYHAFLFTTASHLKLTNCHFVDLSSAPHAMVTFYWNVGICYVAPRSWSADHTKSLPHGSLTWLENNVMIHPRALKPLPIEVRDAEIAVSLAGRVSPRHVTLRNCAVGNNLMACLDDTTAEREFVKIEHCTIFGRTLGLLGERQGSIRLENNVVICPDNPVPADPPGLVDRLQVAGANNLVWLMSAAARNSGSRNQGSLRLLPGPALSSMPNFAGPSTDNDPLRPFRLMRAPSQAKSRGNNESVGVRVEYLAR